MSKTLMSLLKQELEKRLTSFPGTRLKINSFQELNATIGPKASRGRLW
jgi:hypothetical protein